jgi:hypothetical protein
MDEEKERIYKALRRDFDEFASSIGGWSSEIGTELDGLLWKEAGQFAEMKDSHEFVKLMFGETRP